MFKYFLFFLFLIGFFSCKTSKSLNTALSQNWVNAKYVGVLRCKYCLGKNTELNLNNDGNFKLQEKNINSNTIENCSGKYYIIGDTLSLQKEDGKQMKFLYDNKTLRHFYLPKELNYNLIPQTILHFQDGNINMDSLSKQEVISSINGKWTLISFNQEAFNSDNNGKETYIEFFTNQSRVVGNAGCNRFNGTFTVEPDGKITFGLLAMTKMMCPNIANEQKFSTAIGQGTFDINYTDENLVLSNEYFSLIFRSKN